MVHSNNDDGDNNDETTGGGGRSLSIQSLLNSNNTLVPAETEPEPETTDSHTSNSKTRGVHHYHHQPLSVSSSMAIGALTADEPSSGGAISTSRHYDSSSTRRRQYQQQQQQPHVSSSSLHHHHHHHHHSGNYPMQRQSGFEPGRFSTSTSSIVMSSNPLSDSHASISAITTAVGSNRRWGTAAASSSSSGALAMADKLGGGGGPSSRQQHPLADGNRPPPPFLPPNYQQHWAVVVGHDGTTGTPAIGGNPPSLQIPGVSLSSSSSSAGIIDHRPSSPHYSQQQQQQQQQSHFSHHYHPPNQQQQRSVSFHISPPPPATAATTTYRNYSTTLAAAPTIRGADQHVARTTYDSTIAGGSSSEARYRPYPEIQQMTQSTLVQPGSDILGGGAAAAALPPSSNDIVVDGSGGDGSSVSGGSQSLATKRASEAAAAAAAAAMRRKRRTQACEYCHLKKIKCEGDGIRCINCVKNDVQCQWGQKRKRGPKPKASLPSIIIPSSSSSSCNIAATKQQQQLQRTPTVVSAAAAANKQAATAVGGGGDDSDYGGDADTRMDPSSSQSPGSEEPRGNGGESLRAPRMEADMLAFFSDDVVCSETREAVRYYFDYFYPLCPMFHPSMFIRRVVRGDVDPLLIDAMKAASAGVVTRMTGRLVDGAGLARSVKQRILEKLESPDVDLVRVLVIMTLLAGSQGEMMAYNSLICLAASLVVRLGWHKMDLYKRSAPIASWDEWVAMEVKRRVFWLVYQTDSYQAMLTGRPMSIAEDSVFVSAPCSDYEWDVVAATVAIPPLPTLSLVQQQPLSATFAARVTPPIPSSSSNNNPVPPPPGRHHLSSNQQRSSRSSSASAASVVQSLRVDQHAIVATGAFSFSFMSLCELTAIIAHINTFLCDAKSGRLAFMPPAHHHHHHPHAHQAQQATLTPTTTLRDGPFPAVDFLGPAPLTGSLVHPVMRTVSLLSEYPAFVELDERLEEWKRNLLMPEDLRDDATAAADITYFGNADHRRFMMRVRYFCLHCYYVPITLFLHQSNRPSFFTEYEQPLAERLLAKRSNNTGGGGAIPLPRWPVNGGATTTTTSDDEDAALRHMLNAAFASTWNEGLLAYDVDDRSWRVCLLAAHGLSEHLERNTDFPLERFDQVIPFCIFMSISVLIRQVRMCSRLLEAAAATSTAQSGSRNAAGGGEARRQLAAKGGYMSVTADRSRCIKHVKQQWATLQRLGSMWNIDGMEVLLKSMQIDEVANAADMFSGMSL